MKMDSKQGMEFSIDRILGQWLFFARDWRPISTDAPEPLCALTDAMDGLLYAQQRTSDLRTQLPFLGGSQQFSATFGISQWAPVNESILINHLDQTINFSYQASGQTCFRGELKSILALDNFGIYREVHSVLSPGLTLRKFYQFSTLFPWVKHIWIYISTVVTAHFLKDHLKRKSYAVADTPLHVLGYKAQFDQRSIESRMGMLSTHPLGYSVTMFEVGQYDAITLSVYLANKQLMRIDLGLAKPSVESSPEDLGLQR
jgi:hypothetical protein